MSPTLQNRFLSIAPPGKSLHLTRQGSESPDVQPHGNGDRRLDSGGTWPQNLKCGLVTLHVQSLCLKPLHRLKSKPHSKPIPAVLVEAITPGHAAPCNTGHPCPVHWDCDQLWHSACPHSPSSQPCRLWRTRGTQASASSGLEEHLPPARALGHLEAPLPTGCCLGPQPHLPQDSSPDREDQWHAGKCLATHSLGAK